MKKWQRSKNNTCAKGKDVKGKKSEENRDDCKDWRDSHLFGKIHMLLLMVANDKMVQPFSFSENRTKGTASVVSRQLSWPLGVVWSYL